MYIIHRSSFMVFTPPAAGGKTLETLVDLSHPSHCPLQQGAEKNPRQNYFNLLDQVCAIKVPYKSQGINIIIITRVSRVMEDHEKIK